MKNTILGFDIGGSQIKIAEKTRDGIRVHTFQTPENLVADGVIQMPHLMTDYLKGLRKELKLKKGPCALIVPDTLAVCRTITLPAMSESQLEINLPFEFSDYISGEPQKYIYDYALQEMVLDEEGTPKEMLLMGAAMSKEWAARYHDMFKDAGFSLRVLIPQEMALINLMTRAIADGRMDAQTEYCVVSLNHSATEIYIIQGKNLRVMRNITLGGADIDQAIAEHENVDAFVARTYKNTNYNQVQEREYCRTMYGRIAVEIMKVINFYRFNNRESQLNKICFAGGGSHIQELCTTIAETNQMEIMQLAELLPKDADPQTDASGVLSIGSLLQ